MEVEAKAGSALLTDRRSVQGCGPTLCGRYGVMYCPSSKDSKPLLLKVNCVVIFLMWISVYFSCWYFLLPCLFNFGFVYYFYLCVFYILVCFALH